jgi:hypothetical protein
VLTAIQQLGGAVGIAVLGTVFFSAGPAGGFGDSDHAFALALGVEIALIALAFGLTFLLPGRPRAEGGLHGAPAIVEPLPAAA